ncbi:MAG: Do family serine endopeptidase, partial [bacterium]|nr:Do family serine endopeptidase [bacterium]
YIVTNNHVVDGGSVTVRLSDGREFDGEVVGADDQTDVAVIKVDATELPTLPLGDSDALEVGEWVMAIGSPFGLDHTVTAGIVSARGRGNVQLVDYADFIQTDAAINPGNSGGPLLNIRGEVVGMNTAIFSRSGGYMGIGFAIPINMVNYVESQLRDGGSITRGFLGVVIQNLTPKLAKWFDLEDGQGVLISEVSEDSPAERAGLKAQDVVVEFDGQPVTDSGTFRSRVASTAPGEKVDAVVLRNGKRVKKTIKIGTLEGETLAASNTPAAVKKLGLTVQALTDEIAARFEYEGAKGVIVTAVEPGSAAAAERIRPGALIVEVNWKPVRNEAEFKAAIGKSDPEKGVLLRVREGEHSRLVALEME